MIAKAFLLALSVGVAITFAASSGSISGTVTDSAGKPVAGVAVSGVANAAQSSGTLITVSTVTAASGGFALQGLAPGAYNLCAIASTPGQISSCKGGTHPTVITVSPGSNLVGIALVMGSGDVVTLNVTDISARLAAGGRLSIGFIGDNGRYDFAELTTTVGNVYHYQMTIPRGHTSWLVVDTALTILDGLGASVVPGQKGKALSGSSTLAFTLS